MSSRWWSVLTFKVVVECYEGTNMACWLLGSQSICVTYNIFHNRHSGFFRTQVQELKSRPCFFHLIDQIKGQITDQNPGKLRSHSWLAPSCALGLTNRCYYLELSKCCPVSVSDTKAGLWLHSGEAMSLSMCWWTGSNTMICIYQRDSAPVL